MALRATEGDESRFIVAPASCRRTHAAGTAALRLSMERTLGKVRERLGMSQGEFAAQFGISTATLRNWEQRRREPEGPARVLLNIIEREPEAVRRALG